MSNFSTATEATETALNSAGSAARENSRYMEGLEAKTQAVRAAFETLANNVLNESLVGTVLDLARAFLELSDNAFGRFLIQTGLITGVLWGGSGLIQAMKVIPAILGGFATSAGTATAATAGFAGILGLTVPQLALIAAGIAAIIAIAPAASDWFNELTGNVEYFKEKLSEANSELESNKTQLQSLESTAWYDRTPEIESEINALKQENAELEENIALWRDRVYGASVNEQEEGSQYLIANQFGNIVGRGKTEQDAINDAIIALKTYTGPATLEGLEELGYTLEMTKQKFVEVAQVTKQDLVGSINEYIASGEMSIETLNEIGLKLNENILALEQDALAYKQLVKEGVPLTELQEETIDLYNEFTSLKSNLMDFIKTQESLGNTVSLTTDEYYNLIAIYPQLQSMISQTTEGYQLESSAITDALLAGEDWAWGMIENQKKLTDTAIQETQARLDLLVEEQRMMLATLSMQELLAWSSSEEYKVYASQVEGYMNAIARLKKIRAGQATGGINLTGVGSGSSSSTAKGPIEEQNELFKEQLSILEDRLSLLQESGAPIEEQIELLKQMQDTVHEQAEWYRSQGLDENSEYLRELGIQWWKYYNQIIELQKEALDDQLGLLDDRAWFIKQNLGQEEDLNEQTLQDYISLQNQRVEIFRQAQEKIHALAEAYRAQGLKEDSEQLRKLGKLWWDYENQINDVNKNIADNQERVWEEAMQAQIDAIQSQVDVYKKLFSYISNQIDKEIKKLQEQRDKEEEYWDAKIQALKDQNDEIERQIQLEQLQQNLAAAKQQQMLVYKDGRFQYVQNVQAISEAETELEAFEREEALRQEVENLKKLKEQALASIDEQIAGWEEYKEQWSSVVDHYQEEQDRLLLEQELGIELEGELWKTRLDNLSSYVSEYESLMARLTQAQNALNAGFGSSSGGGSSGGGWGGSGGGMVNIGDDEHEDVDLSGYPEKPSQDIHDDDWKDYIDSGGSAPGWSGSHTPGGVTNEDGSWSPFPGGPVYKNAKGTLSSHGGLSLVGEEGPELRVLNQGDGIIPSNATKNLIEMSKYSLKDLLASKAQNVYSYMFDKLVLPNVTDAQSFVNELKRFKQYAYQQ